MAIEDIQEIQNRLKINGQNYEFIVDQEPIEGSGNPITSGAVFELRHQLAQLLGRPVEDNIDRHPIIIVDDEPVTRTFSTSGLASAEGVRTALDAVYDAIGGLSGGGTGLNGDQVQSDWEEDDDTKVSYIKNKPNIPDFSGTEQITVSNSERMGTDSRLDIWPAGLITNMFNTAIFNYDIGSTRVSLQEGKGTTYFSHGSHSIIVNIDGEDYAFVGCSVNHNSSSTYDSPNCPTVAGWLTKWRIPEGFDTPLQNDGSWVAFRVNDEVTVGNTTMYISSGCGLGQLVQIDSNTLRMTATCCLNTEKLHDPENPSVQFVQDIGSDRFSITRDASCPNILTDEQIAANRDDTYLITRDYNISTGQFTPITACTFKYASQTVINKPGSTFNSVDTSSTLTIEVNYTKSIKSASDTSVTTTYPRIKVCYKDGSLYKYLSGSSRTNKITVSVKSATTIQKIKTDGITIFADRCTITDIKVNSTSVATNADKVAPQYVEGFFTQTMCSNWMKQQYWIDTSITDTSINNRMVVRSEDLPNTYWWFNFTSTHVKHGSGANAEYFASAGVSTYVPNGLIVKSKNFMDFEFFFYPDLNIGLQYEASCYTTTSGSSSWMWYACRRASTPMYLASFFLAPNNLGDVNLSIDLPDDGSQTSRSEFFSDGAYVYLMHGMRYRTETAVERLKDVHTLSQGSIDRIVGGFRMEYPSVAVHMNGSVADYFIVSYTDLASKKRTYVAKFRPFPYDTNKAVCTLAKILNVFS